MPKRRSLVNSVMLIAVSVTGMIPLHARSSQAQVKRAGGRTKWGQTAFHGLVVGKSTPSDLVRTFGKPKFHGPTQDVLLDSDKEGEIGYDYREVAGVDGRMEVAFAKRSGVMTAIKVYPTHLTRNDVLAHFGTDFEESNDALGACPTVAERQLAEKDHDDSPPLLVYRRLGVTVDLNRDGSVFAISYLRTCR